ncbi:RagB/SusD family nutrient uptake outer membrane protein [Leeuwenhoekiella polynyae]|uniref:SusD-like starch-binding protein associating with outer membrane n=1 Tax=Leeuwenhoekiella polynyae TaxID=1550906 RepID=A0A4Q0PFF6_9FLAO|nr:RagB/SusD family nutrient uptake outer membrane protein [Leeuwenhoekiella polynyae]RXG25583.1 SusD-like starch-binding protein associating with outer membrane [Leeuwenhoekiella polynyae]
MKKYITLILLSVLALSCSEDLDQTPISEQGSNNFYRNTADFESAVTGIYSTLQSYPVYQFYLSETRSDNLYAVSPTGVRAYDPINAFDRSLATNTIIADNWNTDFTGIFRANTVLDQLTSEVVPDAATLDRLKGEAKFLRAFFYFDLVRTYGKVPVFNRVYTPTETLEVPRAPVAEVYDLILADLIEATTLLPDSYGSDSLGKVTSWAAKAILGQVYLTRSGPTYGIEGPGLDSDEYNLALEQFNDIIENGPFGFADDYARIFDYNNEHNEEIVFNIEYLSGGVGVGAEYPSVPVPDGYLRVNSVGFSNGETAKQVSADLINTYEEEDIRADLDILQGYTDQNGNFNPVPFYTKYLNLDRAGQDRFDWGLNYPLIRYTDIITMKAEAILMGGTGTQAEVDAAVNAIRDRAGLTPIAGVDLTTLLQEKRLEFAGESRRWYDLVRTGTVVNTINSWIEIEDVQNRMQTMDENQILFPVPSSQITVKENLYDQNPGYN